MPEICNVLCAANTVEIDGGAPVRIQLSVPCRLVEVGPLPRAGSFVLSNESTLTYAGHDGGAWIRSSELNLVGGTKDGHRDWLRQRNLLPIPKDNHPATGRPVTLDMQKGYVAYGQSGINEGFDQEPLHEVAAQVQAVVARNIVVSDGQFLARAPLPTWQASMGYGGAYLSVLPRGSYMLGGMAEFGISREAEAIAFAARWQTRFGQEQANPGRIDYIDPAFDERDDRVEVAVRAAAFVSNQLRFALGHMDADTVRLWHSAAHARTAAASGLPWDHEEVLRDVASLIAFGEDKANKGNTRTDGGFWDAHRMRLLDVEGVRPREAPAPSTAPMPV